MNADINLTKIGDVMESKSRSSVLIKTQVWRWWKGKGGKGDKNAFFLDVTPCNLMLNKQI
jgi:hypothetical protein